MSEGNLSATEALARRWRRGPGAGQWVIIRPPTIRDAANRPLEADMPSATFDGSSPSFDQASTALSTPSMAANNSAVIRA